MMAGGKTIKLQTLEIRLYYFPICYVLVGIRTIISMPHLQWHNSNSCASLQNSVLVRRPLLLEVDCFRFFGGLPLSRFLTTVLTHFDRSSSVIFP